MGRVGGIASTEIDAPIEEVWAVLADVLSAHEWQSGLLSVTALEHDEEGRPTLVGTETDIKVRTLKTEIRFDYEAEGILRWRQEKGDLKSLEGCWTLEAIDGGRTRAIFEVDGDPGRVLGMLIRGPIEATLRATLVDDRPFELKTRVEGARSK